MRLEEFVSKKFKHKANQALVVRRVFFPNFHHFTRTFPGFQWILSFHKVLQVEWEH